MKIFFAIFLLFISPKIYAYEIEEIVDYIIDKIDIQQIKDPYSHRAYHSSESYCSFRYSLYKNGKFWYRQSIDFKDINRDTVKESWSMSWKDEDKIGIKHVRGACNGGNQCVHLNSKSWSDDRDEFRIYLNNEDDPRRVVNAIKDAIVKCGGRGELY